MKRLLPIVLVLLAIAILYPQKVDAATLSCAVSFPNEVACYDSGLHGIPGDLTTYTGFDVVFKTGDKNFLQVFQGTGNDTFVEKKSFWMATANASCFPGWTFVPDAKGSGWGDYFPDGVNYCVFTL